MSILRTLISEYVRRFKNMYYITMEKLWFRKEICHQLKTNKNDSKN